MLLMFLRYFFLNMSCFYSYCKIINCKNRLIHLSLILVNALNSIITITICNDATSRILTTIVLGFIMLTTVTFSSPVLSCRITIVSFCISYILLILSSIPICFIFSFTYKMNSPYYSIFIYLGVGILQVLLSYFSFKSKRMRNGILLLAKHYSINIGIIFSCILIAYILYESQNPNTHFLYRISAILLILFLSLVCLYYWRHRITQTYREKLRLANEKSLEYEIATLKTEITTLQADNQHLKQIVHKDNKLVPAMETTVMDFLQSSGTLSAEELSARGSELSTALHEMALQRKGILDSLSPNNCGLPTCGLHTVDGLLAYMEKRAKEYNINYKVKIDDNVKDLISTSISEEDLRHLLGDLIENALIATRYSDSPGKISIHLGNLQNRFLLEISDSGIPFTPETYQHLGHEQHTTHNDDGGSGIGLMDIWKIKKKYRASLQIYEHKPSTDIFSKKISFVFDRKNHFLIQTYRDKELQSALTRGDAHVFPYEAD